MFNLKATIQNGEIIWHNQAEIKRLLDFYNGKEVSVEIKQHRKTRTDRQNRALHLWFTQLARELNDNGQDMRQVISKEIDIAWSPYTVKEHLFRTTMKAMYGYKSTKQLKTNEIDKIFDVITKAIGERTGLFVPFPSLEQLINREEDIDNKNNLC
jgi:Ser-tRNA(Ala) deacylase AlaX